MKFFFELWRQMCKQKKSTENVDVTVCKPQGSQTGKPLKQTVNNYKPRSGLCLEVGAKLWYRYYTICYLCNASLSVFFCSCLATFSSCCLILCFSGHMYFIIRQNSIADPSKECFKSTPTILMYVRWWGNSVLVLSYLPPFPPGEPSKINSGFHYQWSLEN